MNELDNLTFGQKAVGITDLNCDDEVFQSLLSFANEIDRLNTIMKSSNKYSKRHSLCKKAISEIKKVAKHTGKAITEIN